MSRDAQIDGPSIWFIFATASVFDPRSPDIIFGGWVAVRCVLDAHAAALVNLFLVYS